jgi:alpha 1,3-glucosidase
MEVDLWEESFGSHRDSKPYGPSSVGMDVTFDGSQHVYGLAEHAAPLNLPSTSGSGAKYSDPYRMYTLDVYDYELDSPMALYGGVPLLLSHTSTHTVGVLWFNPSETFIDISRTSPGMLSPSTPSATKAYWMSESGVVDVMLLPGPTPASVFGQYAGLTGTTPLPPRFSLGYHQCRWNYNDEDDVRYVHGQFESLDIPYDVLWLDIEHTDGKRYFTWDSFKFPKPKEMQEELAQTGRKMVTIVDPHIKKDDNYAVYKEAHDKKLFIQKPDGSELDGWCWPGSSAYLDFTSEMVRDWWAGRFAYDKYEGSTPTLYTWNDMNEPSVFNGPEVSMDKDAKSLAGVEHREWHNLYGMYMAQATSMGLLRRNEPQDKRPFVLSRSFYAGSQRWGAIWTGDNACKWSHLEAALPMLLTLGLCGITFSGADVGGFLGKGGGYGDPDAELFTRWFQAGAYQPFFRGHAHHDSARREPWTFDEGTTQTLRNIAMQRYQLLSYWYTVFFNSESSGMPTMRPMWVAFPEDTKVWDMERQFMAGPDLMVVPVTAQGATTQAVYFPGRAPWYDAADGTQYAGATDATVAAPIEKVPVFQRGGSIVPRQMRLRRSSVQMANDPFTLTIAPDGAGEAAGRLYLDAGDGYAYRAGKYAYRKYSYAAGKLTSAALHADPEYAPPNLLERIEVLGVSEPKSAVLTVGGKTSELGVTFAASTKRLVVRMPNVPMASDWTIELK